MSKPRTSLSFAKKVHFVTSEKLQSMTQAKREGKKGVWSVRLNPNPPKYSSFVFCWTLEGVFTIHSLTPLTLNQNTFWISKTQQGHLLLPSLVVLERVGMENTICEGSGTKSHPWDLRWLRIWQDLCRVYCWSIWRERFKEFLRFEGSIVVWYWMTL